MWGEGQGVLKVSKMHSDKDQKHRERYKESDRQNQKDRRMSTDPE